ncbi:MAG TPA: site-specific integrase [Streptosporangiaceae bacterium]|nr:site-specific integrase [Streptosporangiaceae bacterium]
MVARSKATPRRPNREGKPYQRKSDGRWVQKVYPPKGSLDTKPHYEYGATKEEVVNNVAEYIKRRDAGKLTAGREITVGEYMRHWTTVTLEQYLTSGDLDQDTVDSYRDNTRLHITPHLSHLKLVTELNPVAVREWQDLLLKKPSSRTPKKQLPGEPAPKVRTLSVRTVTYQRAILHKALEDAIRDEVAGLERNVVDKVQPPKNRDEDDPEPVTPEEAALLLLAMSQDELWAYWLIAFATGFRRGEGLGMRWQDLDRVNLIWRPRYQVRRQPGPADPETGKRGAGKLVLKTLKTKASRQPIALPRYVGYALDIWEAQQNGLRAQSDTWADLGLVFTTKFGTALEPRNVNRAWAALCKRAGVRYIRLHDLRHACATYLLAHGVDLKSVQGQLRHARLATTEIYVHALAEVPRKAAEAMDLILADLGAGASPDDLRRMLAPGTYGNHETERDNY